MILAVDRKYMKKMIFHVLEMLIQRTTSTTTLLSCSDFGTSILFHLQSW